MDRERYEGLKDRLIMDIATTMSREYDEPIREETEDRIINELSGLTLTPLKNIHLNRLLEFEDDFNTYATVIDYNKWSRDELQRAEIDFVKYFDISKDEARELDLDAARSFADGYWFDRDTMPRYTDEVRLYEVSYYQNDREHSAGFFTDMYDAIDLEMELDECPDVDWSVISDMSVQEALDKIPVERPVERRRGRFKQTVEKERELDI